MSGGTKFQARLMGGAAFAALMLGSAAAAAEPVKFDIAPQSLTAALNEFGVQSNHAVLFTTDLTGAKLTRGVNKEAEPEVALAEMLSGTGLAYRRSGDTFLIVKADADPQSGSAAGDGADGTVDTLVVTAQKREEDIQDVPIAISAFSQKSLEEQKIEGGFDLLKAIPNVTFSKSNFSSYNFSIRGVGTKAVSATTDPGVAVAFNNTTLVQNRLFEQEYFDVERVEVLRGPQGTLYGRNATAGVINVISAKPKLHDFEGSLKLEAGNYDSRRLVGMLNAPIIEDRLAIRIAGAMTQRSGYDYNSVTNHAVNGRDLWSTRVTVAFEPTETMRINFLWEHFEEDDDRSRTGKQLCHPDPGPQMVGSTPITGVHPYDIENAAYSQLLRPALFSQACKPGSLYDDAAFGTPNGAALPFVFGAIAYSGNYGIGTDPVTHKSVGLLQVRDPYGGLMQSRDLRSIASFRDPRYEASADLLDLSIDVDLTDSLTLISQTVYNEDTVYSFQDYNRFNTFPIFTDTSEIIPNATDFRGLAPRPAGSPVGTAGVFCDPQLGCSDTIAGFDISQASGLQFSQEIRLQSDLDGPVNFSFGANYTKFDTLIDYYVFYNVITSLAMWGPLATRPDGITSSLCPSSAWGQTLPPGGVPLDDLRAACPYIDPNPIESINGEGHNYFRSKNPYELRSKAVFGELYWKIDEDFKLTAGLRYTDDRKVFTPVPSQVLLFSGIVGGGAVNRGYPTKPDIKQEWGEFTGRLGLDWKPVLPFTDETMAYAFYSHGYKGGGANPPSPGFATYDEALALAEAAGASTQFLTIMLPVLKLTAVEYGPTFAPEFVNAFEIGAKNTLLGGSLLLNVGAFYYDYTDYQVSQIRDRTAVNENFDAKVWGLEFETVFTPSRNLKVNANLGYLDTEIADGETSIDIMNRTQGDPRYITAKPWPQLPSNCVVPIGVAESSLKANYGVAAYNFICGGYKGLFGAFGSAPTDPATNQPFDFANYPELNGGAGIKAQIGGNELPNSPHWTSNVGAQYGVDFAEGWRATVRGDVYWQSQSYARVYNAVNDKLHGWWNANLSVWVEQPDWGLKIELYAKNILDDTPITDAFLNSDDSGLTTNVFVLDPRLIGLSIRKEF